MKHLMSLPMAWSFNVSFSTIAWLKATRSTSAASAAW
jgi:hypothetical protein